MSDVEIKTSFESLGWQIEVFEETGDPDFHQNGAIEYRTVSQLAWGATFWGHNSYTSM